MTILKEKNLQITLPTGVLGKKFDSPAHGLSHCMKAVDFIVELSNILIFIEFKDPDHSDFSPDNQKWIEQFLSGKIDHDLMTKYRDTWLYEWASGNIPEKPIHYYVLIGSTIITKQQLHTRTDALKRLIPLDPPKSWKKSIIAGCAVMNLEIWNQNLSFMPVQRVS